MGIRDCPRRPEAPNETILDKCFLFGAGAQSVIFPVTLVAGGRARLVTTAMVPQSSRVSPSSRPEVCARVLNADGPDDISRWSGVPTNFALGHSLITISDQAIKTRGGNVLYTSTL